MTTSLRLLALTDATGLGGAELSLGYLLGALDPAFEVAVAGPDRKILERVASHRPGTPTAAVAEGDVRDHVRAVRSWRPDVVHINRGHLYAGEAATVAGLLIPGVSVVAVEHLPYPFPVGRRTIWRRRALDRRLDAHVSVGERAARLVEEIVGKPPGSVMGIANGVAPVDVEPVARPVRGLVVGSVGRLTDQKGFDALVRALPSLPSDVTVVLVGDGPERGALETMAARLGVADRLLITGWTDEPRRWLPMFDVFALPSRWEGLPLAILEAMHAGVPVVATDVGSVAEAVRDGETGYVVAAGDADALGDRLAALFGDAGLRWRMGASGAALARERFTAAAMARSYEALYRRMSSRSSLTRTTRRATSRAG